jgi:hypothetical protein
MTRAIKDEVPRTNAPWNAANHRAISLSGMTSESVAGDDFWIIDGDRLCSRVLVAHWTASFAVHMYFRSTKAIPDVIFP